MSCKLRRFGLTWSDADFVHRRGLTILDSKNGESGHIPRTKAIPDALATPIGYPEQTLFKNSKEGQVEWLSKVFKSAVDRLGFNNDITDRREKVTFHT